MSKDILSRRVAKVLPDPKGLEKLMSKRKIKLYQGFDPTGTRLHLGHSVGLRKLMEFARAGHEVIFLFGTGTVLVGDPSLREHARELITEETIEKNITDWKKQAAKIVDFDKVKILKNGDWLTKLTIKDIIKIGSQISAIQLFKRESFNRRLEAGDTVWFHETMYPLLQGYDSVVMDVDLEIGGTDQEFNMLMGRELQKKMNNREKWVLETPMIVGTDGKPMSKTSGNCVWLDDEPSEMYGKLMRLPDEHIWQYLELVTDLDGAQIKKLESANDPRAAKARLAREVVSIYHSKKAADEAASGFDSQFKKGELPDKIQEVQLATSNWQLDELLVKAGLTSSKSEARRLVAQGGVRLNQKKLETEEVKITRGDVLQVGKRKFVRIK